MLLLFTMWTLVIEEVLTFVNLLRSTHCSEFLLATMAMQTRLLCKKYSIITSPWLRVETINRFIFSSGSKEKKFVMTNEDLSSALGEQGVTVRKPPYYQ